ncbi:rhodanese-like domain-containing protein [Sulfurivermis fontis]|uniref:rhodanese-like domain-containing protein n=1 Tax=Sulfurivermis fontis TaxID=1972068 RepID=UPI000FD739C7|nr:rhodanese-like domain-containing protein [Sulfurivermis fontis]
MQQFGQFFFNHWDLFLALFVTLAMLVYTSFSARLRGYQEVQPLEAVQLMNHQEAVMLDVREDSEYAAGHVQDSIHIPLGKLRERLGELEAYKGRAVVVGCRSGHRSASACAMLRKQGFERVYNLRGGILAWENASLPVSRGGKRKKK